MSESTIVLDGQSLDPAKLLAVARGGAKLELCRTQLRRVAACADFLREQVRRGEPVYGITTGFGSNADRLLGGHRERASAASDASVERPLTDELQHNLIISHAVGVGAPLDEDIVRCMQVIRINTLMRSHSGIRVSTLESMVALVNAGVVPVVPEKGSVGASGDLAPLSHLAMVLIGEGEAFVDGERMTGQAALAKRGLTPVSLTLKEGLALNNGTAQMLATAVVALERLQMLADAADLAAAWSLEAFAGRSGAFDEEVHALRPHPGQLRSAAAVRGLVAGSTLVDIAYHLVPRFQVWQSGCWPSPELAALHFDISWDWVAPGKRHGREAFYARFLPFCGGKKHQPQDAYSLRCVPQVHGAVRDALDHAQRVMAIELNAVTDNPLVFLDRPDAPIEQQVVSAGHFHGMPLALAMAAVKPALAVLASIAERRLAKLLDSATNDGLPSFLVGNEDATDSGLMIVQYTAAALVNELASRAMPACVYSVPTSANAEDHVSMGTNEARHVHELCESLEQVIALEMLVAAQALDFRRDTINAARALARRHSPEGLTRKVRAAPPPGHADRPQFEADVGELCRQLAQAPPFEPAPPVARAQAALRAQIPFLPRDRPLDVDISAMTRPGMIRALLDVAHSIAEVEIGSGSGADLRH